MKIADTPIVDHLEARAVEVPHRTALLSPKGNLNYLELDELSTRCACGLYEQGVSTGCRVALLVPPGPEMIFLAFALAKLGAVPVLIDPGMGRRNFARCLEEAEPEAFIGIALADWARLLFGWGKRSIRLWVTVGRPRTPGSISLNRLVDTRVPAGWKPQPASLDDPAAIAFTSGSTGPPKGVIYTCRMFSWQAQLLKDSFQIEPGEVDLATFPLFALFDPALQMTTLFPRMDFTRPGSVDPRQIIGPVQDQGVTHVFGSPALLDTVSRFGERNGVLLPSVRRVLSAGAPVPQRTLDRLARMLPAGAQIHTPYGATEALPVSSITHEERTLLGGTTKGRGVCVGTPLQGLDLAVIRISDDPIPLWSDEIVVPCGTVGEIVVWGPNVSSAYFRRPEANGLAKISGSDGWVRHRMGDLGYLDSEGRLWFCGRKAHRIRTERGTLYSVCCEGVFNQHPAVKRSAVVGVGEPGRQTPVLCVELERSFRSSRSAVTSELMALGQTVEMTREIQTIFFHSRFPVDVRHNAKIFREKLALWAAGRLRAR